jgi:hypothetical protein
MLSNLQEIEIGIDRLLDFLAVVRDEGELVNDILDKAQGDSTLVALGKKAHDITKLINNKKIFVYYASIVRLYGLFEQYIENIIPDYLSNISHHVPKYEALPDSIKNNHLQLSLELIAKSNEYKYKEKTEAKVINIIANLNSCLQCKDLYKINSHAFSLHSANLWISQLITLMQRVGVEGAQRHIIKTEIFESYLKSTGQTPGNSDEAVRSALAPLDVLVSRRNQIAHGMELNEIEDLKIIIERIEFIRVLSKAIYIVLLDALCPFEVDNGNVAELGKPIACYDHHILCFEASGITINNGSRIIAKRGDNSYYSTKVECIEIDNKPVSSLHLKKPTKFGIKCDRHVYHTHIYFLSINK